MEDYGGNYIMGDHQSVGHDYLGNSDLLMNQPPAKNEDEEEDEDDEENEDA